VTAREVELGVWTIACTKAGSPINPAADEDAQALVAELQASIWQRMPPLAGEVRIDGADYSEITIR
jgi:hypothetical protein